MSIDHVCVGYGVTADNEVALKLMKRNGAIDAGSILLSVTNQIVNPAELNVLIDVEIWGGDSRLLVGDESLATREGYCAITLSDTWQIAVARYWKRKACAK